MLVNWCANPPTHHFGANKKRDNQTATISHWLHRLERFFGWCFVWFVGYPWLDSCFAQSLSDVWAEEDILKQVLGEYSLGTEGEIEDNKPRG